MRFRLRSALLVVAAHLPLAAGVVTLGSAPADATMTVQPPWASVVSPAVQVNVYTTGRQHSPKVARMSDGTFLVSWSSEPEPDGQAELVGRFA